MGERSRTWPEGWEGGRRGSKGQAQASRAVHSLTQQILIDLLLYTMYGAHL